MDQTEPDRQRRRERDLEAENSRLRERVRHLEATSAMSAIDVGRSTPAGRDELLSAVEKTRMPMILTDPNRPDDPIIFANRAFQELSGYDGDELVGRNCRFLQGADTDPAQVARIRAALLANEEIAIEIVNHRRDGTPFVNELFISPVFDRDGRLLYHFGSQLDVTGLSKARRDLEASERRRRAILESAIDVAIIATDRDGRITEWNAGAERVLGWEANDILGQTAEVFFTPEDRSAGRVDYEMRTSLAAGRASDERWHLRRDGTRFWASGEMMPLRGDDGDHLGFIKLMRDRTAEHESGEALVRSEAYWRGLFSRLREGLVIGEVVRDASGRVEDWRYLDVNPAWSDLVGSPVDDVLGRTIREAIPGVEQVWIDQVASVVDSGESLTFVGQVGRLGRRYEGRIHSIGPERFAAVFREVTAQFEAHRRRDAILDLNDRLRDDVDPASLALVGCEIVGRTLGVARVGYGNVLADDQTFVVGRDWTLPGFPSLVGSYRLDDYGAYANDLRRGETVVIQDVRTDERTSTSAERLESVSARTLINVPVVEKGHLVAILYINDVEPRKWTDEEIAFAHDVAERMRQAIERRRAEHELRDLASSLERQVEAGTRDLQDQQDFARLALTSVGGVGAWTYDIERDLYFCSPAVAELYGLDSAQSVRGIDRAGFIANVHPDDRAELLAVMAGGLDKPGDLECEYRIRHPDDTIRWVLSRGYTYFEDGKAARRVGVGVETTGQHHLEEQLRQSQKMEAVGQLTGGLAHDFNNLLTGITGSLELLGTRVAQGRYTDLGRYIGAAQGAAGRAAALTHRLLAFSRRQTLSPRPTDVNRLIASMEDLVRRTVGPAVLVEVVGAAGLWPTLVDPNQLENALLNLSINARDAMPDGGRLTIETANRWMDQRTARERDIPPGQYVSLCVSDTGTGMSPEVIAKAFDPFFTTKPFGQGTGLGLSMIYGFARQSGGEVRIYSELGQGTNVCLYLPRHLGDADVGETVPELADSPRSGRGETVLVVDDEPTIRMLVTEVLEELGYAAIEASDGASGLRLLQSDAQIDLLVTDVGLPGGMSGRQMADTARSSRPDLKVLFITGFAENAVVGDGHLGQGIQIMAKPFAMEALAARIGELLGGP